MRLAAGAPRVPVQEVDVGAQALTAEDEVYRVLAVAQAQARQLYCPAQLAQLRAQCYGRRSACNSHGNPALTPTVLLPALPCTCPAEERAVEKGGASVPHALVWPL